MTAASTGFRVTVGLEVHCQVKTRTKMFCSCRTSFGDEPNTHVCPVCLGFPGALPVLNQAAIEQTILAGLMLGCEVNAVTTWDRKNYFYPDMPKNYQISQLHHPLCLGGGLRLDTFHYPKDSQKNIARPGAFIRLNHIHLEEDVGKSTHFERSSLLDFNRAGTPLMEIVTEPDMQSGEEAVAFLTALRQALVYGDISDADMEKGQMRCDVNISLRPDGQEELGPKVELKNLNSIGAVRRAIHHEVDRQAADLGQGVLQEQSTRRWDDDRSETQLLRSKEDAHDYRYFPDPDLLPIDTGALVARVRPRLPELPQDKRARFVESFGVTEYDAAVLASDRALADWFEAAARDHPAPKKVANWVINELLGKLNDLGLRVAQCPVAPAALGKLVAMVEEGKISQAQAKGVFAELFERGEGADPAAIAKEMGYEQVSDASSLRPLVEQVLAANPDKAEEARDDKKVRNWFTGQVMKASKGQANPRMVAQLLAELLG